MHSEAFVLHHINPLRTNCSFLRISGLYLEGTQLHRILARGKNRCTHNMPNVGADEPATGNTDQAQHLGNADQLINLPDR